MRRLAALSLFASLAAAAELSPVAAALLQVLTSAQASALGASPSLATVARAVPMERRGDAAAALRPLETAASVETLAELTRAYLYLEMPADVLRVSRLTAAAMPGADGHVFRAWAASEAGDYAVAAAAAREALRLSPGRRDALAVLKLSEGRVRGATRSDSARDEPAAAPVAQPVGGTTRDIKRHEQGRAGLRLLGEAVRARDMGDRDRALELARRAATADPTSPEPALFLAKLEGTLPSDSSSNSAYTDPVIVETLNTMRLSPVGREIADFLTAHKVRISVSDDLPEGSIAIYAPSQDAIFVPGSFANEPAIVRALVLGHEGHHAVQDIKHQSAVTLETEIDSTVRGFAVYRELLEAGVVGMPAAHELRGIADAFNQAVDDNELIKFKAMVTEMYSRNARMRQDTFMEGVPVVFRKAVRPLVVALPLYNNATFARELKASFWGRFVAGRTNLETAQLRHAEEIRWMKQWQKQRP